MTWINSRPGEVVLSGTMMAISYIAHKDGDFAMYQGDRCIGRRAALRHAKEGCEARLKELQEMGIEEVSAS